MSTNDLEEYQRFELLNIDLNHMKVSCGKIHPQWELILKSVQLRVTKELGSEFILSEDISGFSLYSFPTLNFELLSFALIFYMSAWLLDDHLEKFPDDLKKVIEQLKSKEFVADEEKPIEKWMWLFKKIAFEVLSEVEVDQLVDEFAFTLTRSKEMCIMCKTNPSFEDVLEMRLFDAGYINWFFFIFIDSGCRLSNKLKCDPNYLMFNKHMGLHAALVNDLYSLKREVVNNCYRQNTVYWRMITKQVSAQMAANEIIDKINELERLGRMYGERLKEINDPKLSRYVDGMVDTIAGNHYWSTVCKRYNQVASA